MRVTVKDTVGISVRYRYPPLEGSSCELRLTKDGEEVFLGNCDWPDKIPIMPASGQVVIFPIGIMDRSTNNVLGLPSTWGNFRGYLALSARLFSQPELVTADDILGLQGVLTYGTNGAVVGGIGGVIIEAPWSLGRYAPWGVSCLYTGQIAWGDVPLD